MGDKVSALATLFEILPLVVALESLLELTLFSLTSDDVDDEAMETSFASLVGLNT